MSNGAIPGLVSSEKVDRSLVKDYKLRNLFGVICYRNGALLRNMLFCFLVGLV
jgi:hypothetical protein